jgi:hypothetical protein
MKKLATVAGLMILVLLMGVTGTTLRPNKAEARPTDVLAFSPDVCFFMIVGDLGETSATTICYGTGLTNPVNLQALASQFGGYVDDPNTYKDLADASGAQLGQNGSPGPGGQALWVLTFITNDGSVYLDADEGLWVSSGTSQTDCPNADEDCDNDGIGGDGVVVDMLLGNNSDLGDAQVTATQSGIDVSMDYTVVGAPPGDITVSADPTSMICNGLASSSITASLTDGNGYPVADGTPVHFSVQGRAIVDPVNALTIGGTASTELIGLSAVTVTLSAHATSGNLESSVDVECVAPSLGDVNCSGAPTMVDAMLIAQKVAGLIDAFPCSSPSPTPTPSP